MTAVTIAIPFYNAQTYLAQAIESVLWQTHKDFVLLLMDDGSTDGSLDIANKYAEKDPRIKVYSDGMNKNLGFRLNQIPSLVETEFLARMDADDIMHPERITKQLHILNEYPEIDVLGTNVYSIDENNNVIGIRRPINPIEKLQDIIVFIHPSIIARTDWFRNNPYDIQAERIEDTVLWLSTYKSNVFKNMNEPLLFYREIGEDYWRKYFKGNKAVWYILKKKNFQKVFLKFALKYFIAGWIYYIFNFFNKEQVLVRNRNKVRIENKNINTILNEN